MDQDFFKASFSKAMEELAALLKERDEMEAKRDELDSRLLVVRQAAASLARLAGETDLIEKYPELFPEVISPDTGYTDAVREVLKRESTRRFSAVEVRDRLRERGYDPDRIKNPLASIHKILSRLVDAGDAAPENLEGKTVYQWNRPTDNEYARGI